MTSHASPAPSEPGRSYKRRRVVVNRRFQFRFAAVIFLLFGLAAFMVWWEIYNSYNSLIDQGLVKDPAAVRMIRDVSKVVGVKVGVALAVVWFLSILLSHYLAGPIYRLEACLKLLQDGDLLHRARLRTHDEFKILASVYNDALESLHMRIKGMKDAARMNDARASLDKIRAILNEFKV